LKIAIIHEDLSKKGGAENLIIWYSSELIKRGIDITIFTGAYEQNNWGMEYTSNLKVIIDKHFGFTRNPFIQEINGRHVLNLMHNYDIVIVHNWINSSLSIAFRIRRKSQKWVWFCEEPPRYIFYKEIDRPLLRYNLNRIYHEPYKGFNIILNNVIRGLLIFFKILNRLFVKHAFDAVIANSKFTANNIKKLYHLSSRVALLGIGIHAMTDKCDDMKKALGCDFLFFYSGRLDPSKNLVRIIRAFSLVNTMVNYRFVIAGNGELKEYLNKLINRLNLKDKITLVGFISDDSLVSYMNSADVIVYLTINEPFGLVPIEAMVHGKPSLVSSSGGPSETVVNSETGFLANPLDIKDIKTKIEYILNHRDMLNTMSNFCTQTYEQKFTLEKGVDRFLQALLH